MCSICLIVPSLRLVSSLACQSNRMKAIGLKTIAANRLIEFDSHSKRISNFWFDFVLSFLRLPRGRSIWFCCVLGEETVWPAGWAGRCVHLCCFDPHWWVRFVAGRWRHKARPNWIVTLRLIKFYVRLLLGFPLPLPLPPAFGKTKEALHTHTHTHIVTHSAGQPHRSGSPNSIEPFTTCFCGQLGANPRSSFTLQIRWLSLSISYYLSPSLSRFRAVLVSHFSLLFFGVWAETNLFPVLILRPVELAS